MPKFRKKPVVVEAEQWFPGKEVPGVVFGRPPLSTGPKIWYTLTLEGWHEVMPGDWVITGVAGERYPCKDAIFRATYEPTDEEAARALNDEDRKGAQ